MIPEVQDVALLASTGEQFSLSFLEQNITVSVGTDTTDDVQTALEALLTVRWAWFDVAFSGASCKRSVASRQSSSENLTGGAGYGMAWSWKSAVKVEK